MSENSVRSDDVKVVKARTADLAAIRKNSVAKVMKTVCNARLAFKVPKYIIRVKSPHTT
jgi:hypothetical protein